MERKREEEMERLKREEEEMEREKEERIKKVNEKYKPIIFKIIEKIPNADEFFSKFEKNQKGIITPRIPGIFILFDNINFYFTNFCKYNAFDDYKTFIPNTTPPLRDQIEDYLKEHTILQSFLESTNITFDDIISDYILYFISKNEKLQKDSCDIKYIYKILSNLCSFALEEVKSKGIKEIAEFIVEFNCFSSYFTYPLNAIKYLNDERIIEDIYNKILKEIQLIKEKNILYILIESFFNLLINEILLNNEILSKLNYIHIFIMNIINTNKLNIKSKSFYIYMQFKSLYNLIKKEDNKKLNNVYK